MKSYTSDIVCVTLEGEDGGRIGRFDVIKLNGVMTGCGKVSLIRGDAEAVNLAVWVRNCAGANATKGFPEAIWNGLASICAKRIDSYAYRIVWS